MRRGRRTGTGSKDFHAQIHSWYAYSWSAVPKHEILKSSEMLCRVSADISKDRCSSNLRSKQLMKCLQLLSPRKWKHCAYPPDLSMTVDQSKCLNGRETWIYSSTARQYVKFHHQERCEISKPVYYLFIALRSRPPATKTQSDCVHSTKRLFSLLLLLLPHTHTHTHRHSCFPEVLQFLCDYTLVTWMFIKCPGALSANDIVSPAHERSLATRSIITSTLPLSPIWFVKKLPWCLTFY